MTSTFLWYCEYIGNKYYLWKQILTHQETVNDPGQTVLIQISFKSMQKCIDFFERYSK